MSELDTPPVGTSASADLTPEELQLAARNHGMPLEALRYDLTPAGLHYLLVHYDIPEAAPDTWHLEIGGAVDRPLTLDLHALQSCREFSLPVTMECAGNGRARLHPRPVSQPWLFEAVGTARWHGTRLRPLLESAGLRSDALEVLFTGADRGLEGGEEQDYERSLPLAAALDEDVLLAWGMNGAPLPPQHGYPLRLIVPGWYGMCSVKWLRRVTVLTAPYRGYQNERAYRYRQEREEEGEPVTRIAPRALMVPPGIPEFMTRNRFLRPGECLLEGRAWSGHGAIARVEVSDNGGRDWSEAALDAPVGSRAWHRWSYRWDARRPGDYELCCRATDVTGEVQPLHPVWNLGGYAVNAVQRVLVTVTAA